MSEVPGHEHESDPAKPIDHNNQRWKLTPNHFDFQIIARAERVVELWKNQYPNTVEHGAAVIAVANILVQQDIAEALRGLSRK